VSGLAADLLRARTCAGSSPSASPRRRCSSPPTRCLPRPSPGARQALVAFWRAVGL